MSEAAGTLIVDLPLEHIQSARAWGDGIFDLLFAEGRRSPACAGALELHLQRARTIDISLLRGGAAHTLLSAAPKCATASSRTDPMSGDPVRNGLVDIAPGLQLVPAEPGLLSAFLRAHLSALDHIGVNFSHLELTPERWRRFIAELGASVPTYRLQVASSNDIVLVIPDSGDGAQPAVLELVYDRAATRSSFHLCISAATDRAQVERAFPHPCGGYKLGTSRFFVRWRCLPA